jgi:hypothetical protein
MREASTAMIPAVANAASFLEDRFIPSSLVVSQPS